MRTVLRPLPAPLTAVAEIVLVAATLRAGLTAVGPLVDDLRSSLGLSSAAVGFVTTLPLIAFAVLAPAAARVARTAGLDRVVVAALALIAAGTLLRSAGPAVALFVGTAVLGAGIAAGNVLLPSVVKRDFPHDRGTITGVYVTVMVAVAGVAAAVSVPLAHDAGLGWQGALSVWALPALLALALWLPRAGTRRHAAAAPGAPGSRTPWRSALAWQVTLFMGAQSLLFYGVIAWLPDVLQAEGTSAATAGLLIGVMHFTSLAATMGAPMLAGTRPSQRRLVVAACILCSVAFAGLIAAGDELAVVWVTLFGLGSGAMFSLALTLFVLRTRDAGGAAALSGMAQSVGYAIAAIGPPALGALHDATGSWTPPLVAFLGITALALAGGVPAARDRVV